MIYLAVRFFLRIKLTKNVTPVAPARMASASAMRSSSVVASSLPTCARKKLAGRMPMTVANKKRQSFSELSPAA